MDKATLQNLILEKLGSSNEQDFSKFLKRVAEYLEGYKTLRIEGIGHFQLQKEPISRMERHGEENEKNILVFLDSSTTSEDNILSFDIENDPIATGNFTDEIFNIGVDRPTIISDSDNNVDDKILTFIESGKVIEDFDVLKPHSLSTEFVANENIESNLIANEAPDIEDISIDDITLEKDTEEVTEARIDESYLSNYTDDENIEDDNNLLEQLDEEQVNTEQKLDDVVSDREDLVGDVPPSIEENDEIEALPIIEGDEDIPISITTDSFRTVSDDLVNENSEVSEEPEKPEKEFPDSEDNELETAAEENGEKEELIEENTNLDENFDDEIENKKMNGDNVDETEEEESPFDKVTEYIDDDDKDEAQEILDELPEEMETEVEEAIIPDVNEAEEEINKVERQSYSSLRKEKSGGWYKNPILLIALLAAVITGIVLYLFWPSFSNPSYSENVAETVSVDSSSANDESHSNVDAEKHESENSVKNEGATKSENEMSKEVGNNEPEHSGNKKNVVKDESKSAHVKHKKEVSKKLYREIPNDQTVTSRIYTDGNQYTVQASSWRSTSIAEREVRKLKRRGFDAFIVKVFIKSKGSTWNRVRIGYFNSRAEAEEFLKKNRI